MSAGELNALFDLVVAVFALLASLFPIYWSRTHNGSYHSGLNLLLPSLAQSAVGCLLFAVLFALRVSGVIDDTGLRDFARPAVVVFLLLPFTMVVSLHYWIERRNDKTQK